MWHVTQSNFENEANWQYASKIFFLSWKWKSICMNVNSHAKNVHQRLSNKMGQSVTVLSKSLGSTFRRISWLFGAFRRSFASNESSAIFRRIFGTPIVLIRAKFRMIFRCARNIAAKIRRKCARLENSLRIFERTFVQFSKRFWGKFKRHDRNMNLLSVVPARNTAEIYLQTSVYN